MTDRKFDLAAFEEFCRSKPADERYDGVNSSKCALGQFGFPRAFPPDVPAAVYRAAVFHGFSRDRPADFYTFGALADRLAKVRS